MDDQKKEYLERKRQLISILNDIEEDIGVRDSVAMDLVEFDDDDVIAVLAHYGSKPDEDTMLLNSCGESLGEIWIRKDAFNEELFSKLTNVAKTGVLFVAEQIKKEWVKKYSLDRDVYIYKKEKNK
ncbi:MAG: hypothetical protein ACI9YB_001974 [Halioglobus sp.]|jgi:hypothetical protein